MVKSYRKPHTFKKKKSIFRNRLFWFGVLIFSLFCGAIYFVYFSSFFQIKEIIIEKEDVSESPGITFVSDETIDGIRNLANGKIDGKIVFINTRSIFIFNSGYLEKQIAENYKQLYTIKVRKHWPDKIDIALGRKEGVVSLRVGEDYYLLDENGEIFDNASYIDKDGLPILVKPDYFLNSEEKVFSKEELVKILEIKDRLVSLNVEVREFLIFSKDKLIVNTIEGWDIYITLQSDIDWQITKLNAVLEEKIPLDSRGDLEYIEVRFGNLAPIKYKD
ncbi:MAG: cell division protein FtsQ/DivIB [Candidatus Nealsonbacteria bacterium]